MGFLYGTVERDQINLSSRITQLAKARAMSNASLASYELHTYMCTYTCDLINRIMDGDVSTFCAVFILEWEFILTFLADADE
jgi:hypothetical protein